MGNNSSTSNGSLDEQVELFVSSNGQLQMSGGDPSDFEVFWGVSSQFKHFSSEILENGGSVDCGGRANSVASWDSALEEPVDSSDGEL